MNKKIIQIMIDGFGIPEEGWSNSIFSKYCSRKFIELLENNSYSVDACLGVEGIPQSATGQTALFTGVNAAELLGRHYAAFPGKTLKNIISERNILLKVKEMRLKPVFANAYLKYKLEEIFNSRFCSVTTSMTYSIQKETFNSDDLINGDCVFHDITNWTADKNLNIPIIEPEKAAENLLNCALKHDFTLFEYFLTDRAGHGKKHQHLPRVLDELSRFIIHLSANLPDNYALILCSDHGNCENLSIKTHTQNNVPITIIGIEKNFKCSINSIMDMYYLDLEILNYAEKR